MFEYDGQNQTPYVRKLNKILLTLPTPLESMEVYVKGL